LSAKFSSDGWAVPEGLPRLPTAAPPPPAHSLPPGAPQTPLVAPGKTIASIIRSSYEAAWLNEESTMTKDGQFTPRSIQSPSATASSCGSGWRRPQGRACSEGPGRCHEVLEPLDAATTPRDRRPPHKDAPLSARQPGRLAALPTTQGAAEGVVPAKPTKTPKVARSPRPHPRGAEPMRKGCASNTCGYPLPPSTAEQEPQQSPKRPAARSYLQELEEEAAMWEAKASTMLQGGPAVTGSPATDHSADTSSSSSSEYPGGTLQPDAPASISNMAVGEASQWSHPEAFFDDAEDIDGQITGALLAAGIQPGPAAVGEVMRRCESSCSGQLSADWHTDSRQWAAERLRRKGQSLRSKVGTPCRSPPATDDPLAQTASSLCST